MNFNTIAVHGGQEVDSATHSRAVPLYQTSSFMFENSRHAADLFNLEKEGNIYTRISNPTTDILEKRITLLEGGVGAVATASGMAAISIACLNIAENGDEIVSSSALYGGTYTLFSSTFAKLGIKVNFINSDNPEDFEKAINDKTKLIYTESIGNPKLNIPDFKKLAEIAHKHKIPLIVDNTVATPYLLKPFDFGADIVVHSATKFLGGHGTSLGGLVVDSGKFDWVKSGKFPGLTEPDVSYHNIVYTDTFKEQAYVVKARSQYLRDLGAVMSPFNAFLILQGIETLHLRMPRHCENTLKVAEFLNSHKNVSWVNYPGLSCNPYYNNAQKYLPKGAGALIGFGIKGGKEAGVKFIDNVKLLSHLANIGDAKSLVIHPASTTHQQLSEEEKISSGVTNDFIRLSIGIEDINDIIEDMDRALNI